jgi:hypothetical protein
VGELGGCIRAEWGLNSCSAIPDYILWKQELNPM